MTDTRNADLTFAATDYLVYVAALNTAAPTDFADPATGWTNLGWVATDGGLFKLDQTEKDVMAAGSLQPIRNLQIASTKTVQVTFEEMLNPYVRALYDNVPIASLQPTSGITSYDMPDKPADLRYAFIFDTVDGDKRIRLYMPNGKVSDRGDEHPGTQDIVSAQMTFKFFKGATSGSVRRIIDYGDVDVSGFFS